MAHRRVCIFIDFWNFQLGWNSAMNPARCNWKTLPAALVQASRAQLGAVGISDGIELEETFLYASVDPVSEARLTTWLNGTIDRLPSWSVHVRERKPRAGHVHCRACGTVTATCPGCSTPYVVKPEKGVDAAIVTDMLWLAWQGAYDIALLVVNAGWAGKGHDLRAACWASFDLDTITSGICR